MKINIQLGLIILTLTLLTGCGSSPLARPESQATVTATVEIVKETSPLPTQAMAAQEVMTTPTVASLSPLNKELQTVIFTTSGEKGPEIYRVQVDKTGRKAGPVERVEFPTDSQTIIWKLFPSPDRQRVAIVWVQGEATAGSISILDIASGQVSPLFKNQPQMDQQVNFLAWSPNGQNILVVGPWGSTLTDSAWIVDVDTSVYHAVDIKQKFGEPSITSAIFSPDGNAIIYAQSRCFQCGNQIWRITVDGSERKLLFEDSKTRVENLSWSPDGKYIAFVQWIEGYQYGDVGKLYIMKVNGSELRLLSDVITDYYSRFQPSWSTDGQQIVFIMDKDSDKKIRNLYTVDVLTGQVNQLTHFENSQLFNPTWLPGSSSVVFLADSGGFKFLTVEIDKHELRQLGLQDALEEIKSRRVSKSQSVNLDSISSFVWLP